MTPKRIWVCGGRDYWEPVVVATVLDSLWNSGEMEAIGAGGQRGADQLALEWAIAHGIEIDVISADWNKHGRAAGPIRNAQAIREFKPTLVIAFPGGPGTADMIRKAIGAGIEVRRVGFNA